MVNLPRALSAITPHTILVVGDLILDKYTFGTSRRISPEAPVPVVVVEREEMRAGGAANVALNLLAMGMRPRLLGRVGTDSAGDLLIELLRKKGLDTSNIVREEGFVTPTKARIIASAQQLLRIDTESAQPLREETERCLVDRFSSFLDEVSLVAISDYSKGCVTSSFLQRLIPLARSQHIPCISDPKGTDFRKYAGSTILKPNARETLLAAPPGTQTLEEAAKKILTDIPVDILMVTRSEDGISLFYPSGFHEHYPVPSKEVRDVTGAGDTVLAMVSAGYACGLPINEIVPLANIAASCSIERLGCAQVSLHDIAMRILEQHPSGKIWGGSSFMHLAGLLPNERFLVIRIPEQRQLRPQELMRLSDLARQHSDRRPIAYFEGSVQDPKLLEVVASLQCLQFVLHDVPQENKALLNSHLVVDL